MSTKTTETSLEKLVNKPYKYGFRTKIETDTIEKGLNQEVIHLISQKKMEPNFMLNFRLKAFEKWKKMKEPNWAYLEYSKTNYQDIRYYSAPKKKKKLNSLDEVDPELIQAFEKLGISLNEQKKLTNVAVDRILLMLKDSGYTEFARVGSLKKIHKSLLTFSHHSGN